MSFTGLGGVQSSSDSGISDRRRVTIRTEEWQAFWSELTANVLPQPEAPAVDFETQMVIAATMGTRSSGGYSISVEGVFEGAGRLIVQVLEESPGPRCVTSSSQTAPATVVLAPLSDAAVEFDDVESVIDCR